MTYNSLKEIKTKIDLFIVWVPLDGNENALVYKKYTFYSLRKEIVQFITKKMIFWFNEKNIVW